MSDMPIRAALDSPALAVVEGYLRALSEGGGSRPLVRQRSWALREAVFFAAALRRHGVAPDAATTMPPVERAALASAAERVLLGELAAPGFAAAWSALADPVLRGVADAVPATQRARIASLRALATYAGLDLPDHGEGKPALRAVLTPPQLTAALQALTHRLPGRGPDDQVRLAAVLAVMSVWPARSMELSALRLAHLRDDGAEMVLVVPTDGSRPPVLQGIAADRMREWIAVRAGLVAALQGGPVHALWTSIRSNSRPAAGRSLPLPAGMPLRPRGLQRAYARSVAAANVANAERPGFPLPPSLDLLRRSLLATAPQQA
jgi:integrase